MEKRTVLDRVEIEPATKNVFFRLAKQIVDSGEVIASEFHRSVIPVPGNVIDQIELVNIHLAQMGYPPMSDADAKFIEAHVKLTR